jgi:hypothetical protein
MRIIGHWTIRAERQCLPLTAENPLACLVGTRTPAPPIKEWQFILPSKDINKKQRVKMLSLGTTRSDLYAI